jgi:hypothetical protein
VYISSCFSLWLLFARADQMSAILVYFMFFIAWLYLCCGLSQAKCREAVTYIIYLVKQCRQLPTQVKMESKIPKDIHTITKRLKLDPMLESYVCCQKCYSLYNIEISPLTCQYKATCEFSACGTQLFDVSHFISLNRIPRDHRDWFRPSKPKIKRRHPTNPASFFITQNFTKWIEWLLSLPQVEEMIESYSLQPHTDLTTTNN